MSDWTRTLVWLLAALNGLVFCLFLADRRGMMVDIAPVRGAVERIEQREEIIRRYSESRRLFRGERVQAFHLFGLVRILEGRGGTPDKLRLRLFPPD